MAASRFTAATFVAVGSLVAALGLFETAVEVRPYVVGGVAAAQRFQTLADPEYGPAGSRWSRNIYLDDCLAVPFEIQGLLQPVEQRSAVLNNCVGHARSIVATTPTAANAWLVIATALIDLGQVDAGFEALKQAHRAAPYAAWLADRRSALSEKYFSQLDAALRDDYVSDLAVLVQGRTGLDVLAYRYVRNLDLREYYVSVAEAQSEDRQTYFLNRVRFYTAQRS